jgi:hypothetical protein
MPIDRPLWRNQAIVAEGEGIAMATINKDVKFTLDGKHKVVVGDGEFTWNNHFLGRIDPWSDGGNFTATVTLKGSDWTVAAIDAYSDHGGIKLLMKDADSDTGRHIKYLETDDAGSVITLKSTFIKDLEGNDGADKVTLGNQGAGIVHLAGGNDTVIGTSGGCDFVGLGDGNNVYKSGNMWAGTVLAFDGNDSFSMSGNGMAENLNAGGGDNTVAIAGNAWVGTLKTGDGDDNVTVSTSNSIDGIQLGNGDNTLVGKGSGWIASVVAYDGADTVDLRQSTAEFAGTFLLGKGDNTVMTGGVFVSSIVTNDGDDKITVGTGGAGQIVSWGGDNEITSSGWVGSITLRGGNDDVHLLAGGSALSVVLGNGEDTLDVSEVTDTDTLQEVCMFNGGNGNDQISFAAFTVSVDISLGEPSVVDTGHGKFIAIGFENVIGGSAADRLEIHYDGGVMTGGGGADTFVVAGDDGEITVSDFSIASVDKVDLSGLSGVTDFNDLKANHMTQSGNDVEILYSGGNGVLLENVSKDDLTSAQFDL